MLILGHFFLLDMGHGLDMKWDGVANSFGPTSTYDYLLFTQKTMV